MGAQLIKGYSLEGDSQGVAGLSKAWKLYRGKKEHTHLPASIFLIEKKQLKKPQREQSIKFAKKQAGSLLRVRHPGVLAVVQPLTEDDNILAFVTQRTEGCLQQLIKQNKLGQFIASQLELKLYLYPFLETIAFIHDSLKQAHLALSLDSIFLAPDGKWKLAGFGVNQLLTGEDGQTTQQKFLDFSYSAPQLVLSKTYSKKSDVFSVGIIIIRLLEFIRKQYRPLHLKDKVEYEKHITDLQKLTSHPVISKSNNAAELEQLIRGLLSWEATNRWGVSEILASKWMNDSTLITVKYLDKINSYENKQQLEFLKGLAGVLDDFDLRVLTKIILPKLIDLLKFSHLIASIVYIAIDLLKKGKLQNDVFLKLVWPALKNVTQGKQMTAQAIYLFVLNLEIFEKAVGQADTQNYLLPLYIKCFDCPPKLKQLALRNLERLSKKLDYQIFKTKIIPKLINLLKDPALQIRKDALKGLYAIIKVIDVQTMSLSVLPTLQSARKAGSDPFINSIINNIYNMLSSTLPSEVISSKILPVLIPYLSDPSINKHQFYQFKNTIMTMISKIEKDREKNFDNTMTNQEIAFTEADFKFVEEETKAQTEKGNYNFLTSYLENKQASTLPVSPTTTPNNPVNNLPVSSLPTQSNPNHLSLNQNPKNQIFMSYNNPITSPVYLNTPELNTNTQSFNLPQSNFPVQNTDKMYEFNFESNYEPLNFGFLQAKPPVIETKVQKIIQKDIFIQSTIPKVIESPKLQKTVSNASNDTKKQIKKQTKFIGGASGPMEIKKLVGPPSNMPKPKQSQAISMNSYNSNFNFDYMSNPPKKEQPNLFAMNIDNYKGFDMGLNNKPNITKTSSTFNEKQTPSFGLNQNIKKPEIALNIKLSANKDPTNPFAEIESAVDTISPTLQVGFTGGIQAGKGDIYSYFQQQQQKPQPTKKNNSFDLI